MGEPSYWTRFLYIGKGCKIWTDNLFFQVENFSNIFIIYDVLISDYISSIYIAQKWLTNMDSIHLQEP
jgi:hypothetical protein